MADLAFVAPASLNEAFDALDKYGDDAKLIAGGTGLINLMKQRLVQPSALISLGGLTDLAGVTAENGAVRIGGLTTHRGLEASALAKERVPLLLETYRRVATVRIRNVATVGGGLAHGDPNLDPPSTYMALGARVVLTSRGGSREVPIDEFFVDYYETAVQPGEVVTAVIVPNQPAGAGAAYVKFLPRTADDYATVSAAAIVTLSADKGTIQDARIALGSVGSTHVRATAAEAALSGKPATAAALRDAAATVADAVDPLTDFRGSAEYKRDMAVVWARRALEQAITKAGGQVA